MRMWKTRILILLGLCGWLWLIPEATTMAQNDPTLAEPAALEMLLADFFEENLVEQNIPGAVFVMVKDGEIFFADGYGYADLEQQIPYDPARTIVRGGSTIKPITALAVMQLAEQGRLDVHADINQYLTSFQLPDTFAEPVTTHHLLHHTSGIDSKFSNTRVHDRAELEPLADYLARELPPRVAPPGEIRNYNDFGIALAGLVVEEVSGMPFADYVQANIFGPLQMDSTWMIVPDAEVHRLANGYMATSSGLEPNLVGNYLLNNAAGAAYNTTALDLAHLMIAELDNGRYGSTQILTPESMAELHRTQFRHDPHMPGMAYAFDEMFMNGRRLLVKSGGAPGTNNRMVLIPEERVGFFVSYNRHLGRLHNDLTNLIMDTYFPAEETVQLDAPYALSDQQLNQYAGYYREYIGYSATTFEKTNHLINQIQVSANQDGTLTMFGGRLLPVEDDLFQWAGSGDYVAAGQDSQGKNYLFVARTAYERLPWYETLPVQAGLLLLALLIFVVGIIFWLFGLRQGEGNARLLGAVIGAANLIFIAGFAFVFMNLTASGEPPWIIEYGLPLSMVILLAIPLITLVLTVILVGATAVGLLRQAPLGVTAVNLMLIVGCAAFYYFLYTWNLLGYHT